jgi:hypothetical protein
MASRNRGPSGGVSPAHFRTRADAAFNSLAICSAVGPADAAAAGLDSDLRH